MKEKNSEAYYSQIPTKVLLSKKLTCFQKLLYAHIQSLTNKEGYCYASNEYLAECHDKDHKHISKQISALIKHEFIFVFERPTGRNSNYNRKLFTFSTFIQYAKEHGLNITDVVNLEKNGVKNDTVNGVKNDTVLNNNNISNKKKKRIIKNNSNDSCESTKKKKKRLIKKEKIVKIKKHKKEQKNTKSTKDTKIDSKPKLKSKFKLNNIDHRNYLELIGLNIGITKHGHNTKAKINTLDKLHALFTKKCKNPYHVIDCPKQYLDYEWDLDELIEVFEFSLKNANKFNMKKIKSIGAFIFSEGFNGGKSWSPLLFWHQKMKKTAEGELTEFGKKLFKSMTQAGILGINDLDSSIINRVASATEKVSEKYIFVEGGTRTMTYPTGVVSVVSKYIKEKMDKNFEFKLVYITKKGFIEEEFLDMAKKRNILTLKKNGHKAFA